MGRMLCEAKKCRKKKVTCYNRQDAGSIRRDKGLMVAASAPNAWGLIVSAPYLEWSTKRAPLGSYLPRRVGSYSQSAWRIARRMSGYQV
jgi:hypothetical protein